VLVGGVPLGVTAAAIVAIGTASRRWTSDARRARDRERVVCAACLALTAELRSGAHPLHALRMAATEWPDPFAAAMRQAEIGGDVAAALRAAAGPGRSALHAVAAGWQVSERTGAALADVLTAVGDSLRADAAARREADAQLATVRVTARLLAVLPVVSLVLLTGGNLEAVRFLVGTSAGVACLAIAVALVGAGLWWVDRLARSATKPSW
jgi:tight adherence protein B